jgi:hypothetical protein
MATAGSLTVADGVDSTLYTSLTGCTSFRVAVNSGSANSAKVRVTGLHDAGEYMTIEAGDEVIFRRFDMGILEVTAQGDGGNANLNFGIVAKTAGIDDESRTWLSGQNPST